LSCLPLCFFVWLKGLFGSKISVWFFFLRFSISLFNSSFIFCVIIFNSCISLFTVSFVSFWCFWNPLWVPLFVSVSSHVLYFWCLETLWVQLVHSG
jgi:p-aminobenzoyl-glutamate transporter AbgT